MLLDPRMRGLSRRRCYVGNEKPTISFSKERDKDINVGMLAGPFLIIAE